MEGGGEGSGPGGEDEGHMAYGKSINDIPILTSSETELVSNLVLRKAKGDVRVGDDRT